MSPTPVVDEPGLAPLTVQRTIIVTPEPANEQSPVVPLALPAARVLVTAGIFDAHEALRAPLARVAVIAPTVRASRPGPALPAGRVAVVPGAARIPGLADNVQLAPARLTITARPAVASDVARAARVSVTAATFVVVEAGLTRTSPDDGEVVATATPEFIVAVDQRDLNLTYTVELQYADNPAFTDAVLLSQDNDPDLGGVYITAASPVPDTTYWRVRLLLNGVEQIGWSDPWVFTADTAIEVSTLPVSWTVNPTQSREIHLWHFDPPGAEVGDTVTAYGQGFPLTPGRISVAGTPIEIESWTLVPAAADPSVIDGGIVEPEHFEVVFTAPEIEGGGPFVVEE